MEQSIASRKIQQFQVQADQIDQTMKLLYDVKKEIISKTEETKQKIRNFGLNQSNPKQRLSIVVKDRTASLLDRDISHIQNLHDVVVRDLQTLKKLLENHTSIVEKTELIMNILGYKLYEMQFTFRSQFDKLKAEKEAITKRPAPENRESMIALKIFEIDDEITKLEETHQKNLNCIKEQKLDAQKAYERAIQVMDNNFEKMTIGLDRLLVLIEAEKSNLSESQAQLVDSRFETEVNQFKEDIEKFTELQTSGWKILYPDEKISEILQEHGLKVINLGKLVTADGQEITFKEAKAKNLFANMTTMELEHLKANLGVDDDADVDNITPQSSISSTSIASRMSSEDVNYLKQHLGKPLVLALAEITRLQPRDPIHYLGHWLFKYRYNQQMEDVNNLEFEILNEKRIHIAKEKWHKFIEEEARAAVMDMIMRAEEIAIMNELRRIQEEEEAMEEMEGLDDEARDILGPYTGPSTGQMPL